MGLKRNVIILIYYMSNGLTEYELNGHTEYDFMKFSGLLGYCWTMIFTKFHKNQLIIDGEINEKHALRYSDIIVHPSRVIIRPLIRDRGLLWRRLLRVSPFLTVFKGISTGLTLTCMVRIYTSESRLTLCKSLFKRVSPGLRKRVIQLMFINNIFTCVRHISCI